MPAGVSDTRRARVEDSRRAGVRCPLSAGDTLTSAIHTKVNSSLIMRLSCGNTLMSPWGARTFWVRVTASVSAGQQQCTVKIVTNRG